MTQKDGLKWATGNMMTITKQDEEILGETTDLKTKMANRQKINVKELVDQIENDIYMNQNVIKHCD